MVPHCACWDPLAPPLEPGKAVLLPLSSDGSTKQEPPYGVSFSTSQWRWQTSRTGPPLLRACRHCTTRQTSRWSGSRRRLGEPDGVAGEKFRTEAATHPLCNKADSLQYEMGSARAWM